MLDLYHFVIVFLSSKSNFDLVVDIAQIIGGLATGVAFFFIWNTFRHEKNKQQIQLADQLFRDIRQFQQELDTINVDSGSPENVDQWYSMLCRLTQTI